MDIKDIVDKILVADRIFLKQRNKEAELRNKNQKACDEILEELGYHTTDGLALFLSYISNLIPVGSRFLEKVRETVTKEELEVLEKHGIKL